jgi:hypothetical protein
MGAPTVYPASMKRRGRIASLNIIVCFVEGCGMKTDRPGQVSVNVMGRKGWIIE